MTLQLKQTSCENLRVGLQLSKDSFLPQFPYISSACVAGLVYLCINLLLPGNLGCSLHAPLEEYVEKNEIGQTLQNYRSLKASPDICFLGSSAMVSALDEADQLPSFPHIERKTHTQCRLFEELVRTRFNKNVHSFILAAKGSVASDQCLIASAIQYMHFKPKVIIYGATPRDYITNGLTSPASTPVFQCMDDSFNIGRNYKDAYKEANPFYTFLHQHIYLVRQTAKFKNFGNTLCKILLLGFTGLRDAQLNKQENPENLLPTGFQLVQATKTPSPSKEILAKYLLERQSFITDDLNVYALIYKPFPKFGYQQQLGYLDQLISTCKNNSMSLIIVNMPITRENVELLGEKIYDNYWRNLESRAKKNGFTFIDLNTCRKFSCGYFWDSLHLNPSGAKIFITDLVNHLPAQIFSDKQDVKMTLNSR